MKYVKFLYIKTASSYYRARGASLEDLNTCFNFIFFALTAFVGSISSFLLASAIIWALVLYIKGTLQYISHKKIYFVAAVFSLYPFAELLSCIVNQRGLPGLLAATGSFMFFAILPILSRLALSTPQSIVQSTGCGAAAGAIWAFAFSSVEYFLLEISRPEAGLGNPSILAVYALVLSCICVALLPVIELRWRNLLIAGAVCGLGAVVFAGTRAVWFTVPFALGAAAWPLATSRTKIRFDAKFAIASFCVGIASTLGFQFIYMRLQETLASFNVSNFASTDPSISQRMALWRGGWEQAKASWLFGYGPDSAAELVPLTTSEGLFQFTHYHNFLLTAVIRGGIFEVGSQLLIFGVILCVGLQRSRSAIERSGRTMILSVFIAILIPSSVGILFTHDIMNALFVYTIIVGFYIALIEARISPNVAVNCNHNNT